MFTSDKDLKKAVPKRVAKPATAGGAKSTSSLPVSENSQVSTKSPEENEVVAKARAERELRQVRREQASYCLRVQSWWRGISLRKRISKEFTSSITSKIADVKKLVVAMSTKGISFVAPPVVSLKVLRELCFLSRLMPQLESLPEMRRSFLETMLLPSNYENEETKNLLSALFVTDPKLRYLIQFLSEVLNTFQPASTTSLHFDLIEQLLRTSQQFGSNSQNKVAIATNAFIALLFDSLLAYKLLTSLHRTAAKILKTKEDNFLLSTTASQQIDHARSKYAAVSPFLERSLTLFTKLLYHQQSQLQRQQTPPNLLAFQCLDCVFSIPCLTALLSETFLVRFVTEHASILNEVFTILIANAPKCQAIGERMDPLTQLPCGYTILANICGLSSYFLTYSTTVSLPVNTEFIKNYFQCMHSLFMLYPLPHALQGSTTNGVIWKKQGISLTAIGIPHVLTLQIQLLFDIHTIRKLVEVSLPGYTPVTSEWSVYIDQREYYRVEEALSNPSFRIVSNAFIDQQREARSWISSKWAKKLGLSSIFGSSSSTASASTTTERTTGGERKEDGGREEKKTTSSSFFSSFFPSSSSKSTSVSSSSATAAAPIAKAAAVIEHDFNVNIPFLSSTCHLWSMLLPFACYAKADTMPAKAMSFLAFSSSSCLVESLFLVLHTRKLHATSSSRGNNGKSGVLLIIDQFQPQSHLYSTLSTSSSTTDSDFEVLFVLVAVLKMYLSALDDKELYSQNKPFPLPLMMTLITCLNALLFKIIRYDPTILSLQRENTQSTQSTVEGVNLELERCHFRRQRLINIAKNIQFVLMDLYTRWSRRPFCDPVHWTLADETQSQVFQQELRRKSDFTMAIVHAMPWCILFYDRLKWMREELDVQKLAVQGSNDQRSLFSAQGGYRSHGTVIRVRRHRVLEDGMDSLNRTTSINQWKDRFVVRYIDEFGNEEAGIDAGGLFKDFFTDLSSKIFDPNYGLFSLTSDNLLYPNPSAVSIYGRGNELDETYYFVGRVLGKAIYENITIQPQFAHFFLAFIHGRYNFMNLINDLVTLDAELFKNLMFLKDYDGDFSDLGLTFSVADSSLQASTEIDLIPNGRNIPVTATNRHRYIQLIAKYYLHDRIKRQAGPFFAGLRELFPVEISSTYCPPELQVVISGSQQGISAADLKQHTQYNGGYFSLDIYMQRFWLVFEKDFSVEDQAALLKFVTACPRPPSLGFSALYPPFTIQRVECSDDSRLPTASTCFNILKLPTYSSQKVMREKLLLAIHSKSGFDLS